MLNNGNNKNNYIPQKDLTRIYIFHTSNNNNNNNLRFFFKVLLLWHHEHL